MNDIKSCSKLEPGEIPKALSSSKTASSSLLEASDQSVTVYQRSTGIILAPDKWPSIKNLQLWLDKHPDCNVHSSSIHLATVFIIYIFILLHVNAYIYALWKFAKLLVIKLLVKKIYFQTVLPKSYADRLGGEPIASSLSHAAGLEALQMHMMLQQSLMNQSLLGLGAYGPVNPYAMLAAASVSTPSVKVSLKNISYFLYYLKLYCWVINYLGVFKRYSESCVKFSHKSFNSVATITTNAVSTHNWFFIITEFSVIYDRKQ